MPLVRYVIHNKQLESYFILLGAFLVSHTVFVSNFALYGERKLGFGVDEVGYVLAFVGLVNVTLRGFLMEPLIDKFGEHKLQEWGIIAIFTCFGLLTFSHTAFLLYVSFLLFAIGGGLARPLILGNISREVSETKQGAVMGLTNSLGSLSQIVSPLIGGYIIQYYQPGFLPLTSLILFCFGYVVFTLRKGAKKKTL
jgi:DHA1 family tetracycline resistance protein-like MFS transporter